MKIKDKCCDWRTRDECPRHKTADKLHCSYCHSLLEKPRYNSTLKAICNGCRKKRARERYILKKQKNNFRTKYE